MSSTRSPSPARRCSATTWWIACLLDLCVAHLDALHLTVQILDGYSYETGRVWTMAQEAGAPWIGRAGVVAAVSAVVAGIGLATGAGLEGWDVITVASASTDPIAAGRYVLGANNAAHQATKRMKRRR